MRKTLKL